MDGQVPSPVLEQVAASAAERNVVVRARRGSGRTALLRHLADSAASRGAHVHVIHHQDVRSSGLTTPSDGRPVLALVDDLSDLDDRAAASVARVVTTSGARLVGALADGRAVPAPLTTLGGRATTVVQMPPMEAPQADLLMRAVLGRRPGLVARRELLRLADGRAGVLVELLRDLADEVAVGGGPQEGPLPLGRRARRRVERALARLDVPAQRIVERVALGAAVPVAVLDEEDLDAADAAARAGLLDADESGRMRLSDPLVRRLLLDDLPPLRRHLHGQWLLRRLADAPDGGVPVWIAVAWRMLAGVAVSREDMARAAVVAPDPEIAQSLADRASGSAASTDAVHVLARVSLVYGRTSPTESLMGREPLVTAVDPDGSAAAPPLIGAGSFALARQGRTRQAAELIAQAEPGDDKDLARLVQLVVLGDIAEGLRVGDAVSPALRRRAAMIMAWGRLQQGRPAFLPDLLRDGWSAADNPLEATGSLALLGHGLLLGDLSELRDLLDRWAPDTSPGRTARWWLSAELAAARGRHEDALAHLRAAEGEAADVDLFGMLPVARWLAVRVAAEAGIPWETTGITRPDPDPLPWGAPAATPMAMAQVVELGAAGDVDGAAARAFELVATTGEAVMPAVLVLHSALRVGVPAAEVAACLPAVARDVDSRHLLAVVAHVDAAVDGHPERLLAAARGMEAIGQVLNAAEIRCAAGFAWLAEDLPPTPALRAADAPVLTPRERELVRMVGDGLPNAQIAERLTLSVRTVETHLSAAYRKLGVAGRQALRDHPIPG